MSQIGNRSRSPTNNINAHLEKVVGAEVDLLLQNQSYGTTEQPQSRAKQVLFQATKRDAELSSDGRRTVNNIMNETQSAPMIDKDSVGDP